MKLLKAFPLTSRFVIWLLIPVTLAVIAVFSYLQDSLPEEHVEWQFQGIQYPVTVARDQHGVPQIKAKSDMDAYFAMGVLHAQERLWQLEYQRRIARGSMSEILGNGSLSQDIWMRTLGLYPRAEASWEALGKPARDSLLAYANGINAAVSKMRRLPPEFLMLDVKFEPWTALDSLAWLKVFALGQSNSMRKEVTRFISRKYLGEQMSAQLDLRYPQDAPTTIQVEKSLSAIGDMVWSLEESLGIGGEAVGSNAWVVSGQHTETGFPVLANDPHMVLQIPSVWYVANIISPELNVAGMSLVGLPNIVFGRNQHIGWGGTNMMADTQDLFVLDVDPACPNHYRVQDKWEEMQVTKETISVKNSFPAVLRAPLPDVEIDIRETRFGPVVSDFNNEMNLPIALNWTGLSTKDTSYESFFLMGYANDWQAFNDAASYLITPAINLVYADNQGNIGYVGAGKIPLRKDTFGLFPTRAEGYSAEWRGYIPFVQMPRQLNPPEGFIVSANNKTVPDSYPFFISNDWAPPARAARIRQVLTDAIISNSKITKQHAASLLADLLDLELLQLYRYLLTLVDLTQVPEPLQQHLQNWEGSMDQQSVTATIIRMWKYYLVRQVVEDELSGFGNDAAGVGVLRGYLSSITPTQLLDIMQSKSPAWCDDVTTRKVETCQIQAQTALQRANEQLLKLKGDSDNWAWSDMQESVFSHFPFSRVNMLDNLFERRLPAAGATNTVNVAASTLKLDHGFEQHFGAVFRQILVFDGQSIEHAYMNSTGQSGNVLDKHFDDMVEPFNQVKFYNLSGNIAEIESTILLSPIQVE